MKRRCRTDIIFEILKIAYKESNKTNIVYKTNINFRLVNDYINFLLKNDLLIFDPPAYKTTEKGKLVLEKLKELKEISIL